MRRKDEGLHRPFLVRNYFPGFFFCIRARLRPLAPNLYAGKECLSRITSIPIDLLPSQSGLGLPADVVHPGLLPRRYSGIGTGRRVRQLLTEFRPDSRRAGRYHSRRTSYLATSAREGASGSARSYQGFSLPQVINKVDVMDRREGGVAEPLSRQ